MNSTLGNNGLWSLGYILMEPTTCKVILGESIAKPFRADLLARQNPQPLKLVGLLGSTNPASIAYAEWTARACKAVGIEYELRKVETEQGELEGSILEANEDSTVQGIMVYVRSSFPPLLLYLCS